MKNNFIAITCLLVINLMLFSIVGFSQDQATKNFDNIESKISKKGAFKSFENPKIDKSDKTLLRPVDSKIVRKLGISAFTFQFLDYFQRGCYFYRPVSSSCDGCTLLWFDRNGDGLLQVRRELRAVCRSTMRSCDIEIEKITGGGACD